MSDMYAKPKPSGGGASVVTILLIVFAVLAVGMLACGGVLVALLLPAVQAARTAARRMESMNNMRQVVLAFHNYHDTYGSFPAAHWTDENGRKMHSWRTALLPFLEQQPLFDQYNFNVAWDDPQNAGLIGTDISVFRSPNSKTQIPATTTYLAVVGEGTALEANKWNRISSIKDGTANTVLVIEVLDSTTPWAKPEDLDLETFQPPPGPIVVGYADGRVETLNGVSPAQFRALLTRAGND